MRRNGYLWTFGVNLDTAFRFADTDFLLECKISAIDRRFPLIFALYMLNVRHISTSGFLTYWPKKYTTHVDPHIDNFHHVWSCYDHQLPSYRVFVCWYVTWPCDLDLWPFDLEQMSYMASHVTNLDTKYEDPAPVSTWVMSYKVSRWLPLKMRTRQLRMRRITWPVRRGLKQLHFWNPRPRFAYLLCNFGGSAIKVIIVICENNARPCVKRRMSFCACAKSRDLLKVP